MGVAATGQGLTGPTLESWCMYLKGLDRPRERERAKTNYKKSQNGGIRA